MERVTPSSSTRAWPALEERSTADQDDRVQARGARPVMSDLDAAIHSRLGAWTGERVAERLLAKAGSLWAASGKAAGRRAAWLGWLDLPDAMASASPSWSTWHATSARMVSSRGVTRDGGSSLAPELFRSRLRCAGGDAGSAPNRRRPRAPRSRLDAPRRGPRVRSWASEQRTLSWSLQVRLHH